MPIKQMFNFVLFFTIEVAFGGFENSKHLSIVDSLISFRNFFWSIFNSILNIFTGYYSWVMWSTCFEQFKVQAQGCRYWHNLSLLKKIHTSDTSSTVLHQVERAGIARLYGDSFVCVRTLWFWTTVAKVNIHYEIVENSNSERLKYFDRNNFRNDWHCIRKDLMILTSTLAKDKLIVIIETSIDVQFV